MLSEEERNAGGRPAIAGPVPVSPAAGTATAPWAGFAPCGAAPAAIAAIGIYAGKEKGDR